MSSIPTKDIAGDVAVGRNVAIGGNANVQGSVRVGHNLKVEGWLEAPNIKGPNKGLFKSEAHLNATYPKPQTGWWALVGATLPAQIYAVENGAWKAQTNADGTPAMTGEPTVDPTELLERIEEVNDSAIAAGLVADGNSRDIAELRETQETLIGDYATFKEETRTGIQDARRTADTAASRADSAVTLATRLEEAVGTMRAAVALLTPEKVADEATMEAMIKDGTYTPGQIYYTEEED